MARLSNSDIGKIPGITLKEDTRSAPSLDDMKATVRNCYLVIAANTIWLLIPLFGLLTGNVIAYIFQALIVAGSTAAGAAWAVTLAPYEAHYELSLVTASESSGPRALDGGIRGGAEGRPAMARLALGLARKTIRAVRPL